MEISIKQSLDLLTRYIEKENFEGWDPYDGLNSKLFQATPLKKWRIARLAWIQLFKRNPINLRKLTAVEKGLNPKGVALFLDGFCNLYKIDPKRKHLMLIESLAKKLISLKSRGYSGACWGYNFDWQARGDLYFPAGTPTVVATAFAATSLFKAYDITQKKEYLDTALSSAYFVIKDLKRTERKKGFLFSYAPKSGNSTVYNASLMGSKLLSHCYKYYRDSDFKKLAYGSVEACVSAQKENGSWVYGELQIQNWIDSFHTGYNLECLNDYSFLCEDHQFDNAIKKGLDYYMNNFFLEDGISKYYHNKTYPIDIHCPAQLFVTLSKLNCFEEYKNIAFKVLQWTIEHMQDKHGYFYYQINKYYNVKIPYMRWSQAFMLYGMSYFINEYLKPR